MGRIARLASARRLGIGLGHGSMTIVTPAPSVAVAWPTLDCVASAHARTTVASGDLLDPIVLEPAGLTLERGWDECKSYVEKCGGLTDEDGEVNWRAAFGADPGICSCPACHQKYWAWGTKQRCRQCGFEYPTDWWPMYSYGVNAVHRRSNVLAPGNSIEVQAGLRRLHEARLAHPYYRYGYEHPVEDAWKERDKIDWRAVMSAL